MAKVIDIERVFDDQKIGSFHIKLLLLSFLVLMTDGFDLGAAAYAGPGILKEWNLSGGELGALFSSSLAAGFVGPPLFGFLSDKFGRKRVIVCGAYFFGLFTLAAVLTSSLRELIAVRVLAGVALGGMLPIVVTLNNEFAPARVRATLVVLIFTGVTFGGGLPGFVAAKLMGEYGWRSLFWIGGIAPIVIASILAIALPESIKFLALRPRRRNELIALLKRLRSDLVIDPDTEFVISGEQNRSRFSMPALLEGRLAALTPLFWISNFVAVMSLYFFNQWMPTVLSASGIPVAQAAIATTLFQFGGTLAGLISMRFLDKYGFIPVPILFACSIPIAACIGIPNLSPYFLLALLFGAGFCILGLQFGNIATEANIYPTYIRAWGVGSNFAIGRIGGALGPLLGGFAFGAKLPAQQIFLIATLPLIVGLIATLVIMPLYQRHIRILRADQGRETIAQG
ncbi:MAG: MFS transporter [Xanthobacteraceae bacterium]|jgi:MFS transporter, AAHS family, 4-hydroxybenzoate transporter